MATKRKVLMLISIFLILLIGCSKEEPVNEQGTDSLIQDKDKPLPANMPSPAIMESENYTDDYRNFVLNFDQSNIPQHEAKIYDEPQTVQFGRLIDIDENGLFPRVAKIGENFYVFTAGPEGYRVKVYNNTWNFTGIEKTVTLTGTREVDHALASDGEYMYHYAQMENEKAQIRKYDKDLNTIAQTPIFNADPNEVIMDQNIAVFNGKVFAGGEYREEKQLWGKGQYGNFPHDHTVDRGSHIRIYDTDLNLLEEKDLVADLENAVVPNQFWGLGVSQLYVDGYHTLVVHSPIGNVEKFTKGESIGARQIFIARFNDDYEFVDSYGPLSDTDADNFWPTASWYEDGRYFIVYASITEGYAQGPGEIVDPSITQEESLMLSIYDQDFQEIETVNILEDEKDADDQPGGLPGMLKVEDKLYISYVKKKGGVSVREIILK